MNKLMYSLLTFFYLLFEVPCAFAVPIAEWVTPWKVTLDESGLVRIGNVIEVARAFGTGAADGEIRNTGFAGEPLPGTAAVVRERAEVVGNPSGTSIGATSIGFERDFRLTGSPMGWNIALTGVHIGRVFAEEHLLASASAPIGVAILDRAGALAIGLTEVSPTPFVFAGADPRELIFSQPLFGNGILQDGDYTVRGAGFIAARIDEPSLSGRAIADYFTGERRLEVNVVSATPIPEPSAMLLLGTGLAGIALLRKGTMKKHNDHDRGLWLWASRGLSVASKPSMMAMCCCQSDVSKGACRFPHSLRRTSS